MFLPLYSLVMDWVFPLKLSYRIESLRIWEHLMYVLHVLICGDNGIFVHLMYVLVINLQVLGPCELMHRGWHMFSSWLSGRNFGALFEVLCVGWIDEFKIVWCISYNHTHRYLRCSPVGAKSSTLITHKCRGSQQLSWVEYSTQIYWFDIRGAKEYSQVLATELLIQPHLDNLIFAARYLVAK